MKFKKHDIGSEWLRDTFKRYGYEPKNAYEANWFLNDAILELGKHKEFAVEYRKDNGETDVAILTKDNPFDIFYTPIWDNADITIKANCIKWAYEAISYYFNTENTKLYFLDPTSSSLSSNWLGCSWLDNVFINISTCLGYNTSSLCVLNTITHELTHAKQENSLNILRSSKDIRKIDLGMYDFASLFGSISDVLKSKKRNKYLYCINPTEIGANNKANRFVDKIYDELTKKYGSCRSFVNDRFRELDKSHRFLNNGNRRVIDYYNKVYKKFQLKNNDLKNIINKKEEIFNKYREKYVNNNKVYRLNCLNLEYFNLSIDVKQYQMIKDMKAQYIKIYKNRKKRIKKNLLKNSKLEVNEEKKELIFNYYNGNKTVVPLKDFIEETKKYKAISDERKKEIYLIKKCLRKVFANKKLTKKEKEEEEYFTNQF